jgi:hypothetical protein
MGLGGKIDDRIDGIFGKDTPDGKLVAYVGVFKKVAFAAVLFFDVRQRLTAARLGKRVHVDDAPGKAGRFFQHSTDKITANTTRAARYKYVLQFSSFHKLL